MDIGTIVNYRHFINSSKKNINIGIILEIEKDLLILKEGIGHIRRDILRIYWFLENKVPHHKVDHLGRKWYLKENIFVILS